MKQIKEKNEMFYSTQKLIQISKNKYFEGQKININDELNHYIVDNDILLFNSLVKNLNVEDDLQKINSHLEEIKIVSQRLCSYLEQIESILIDLMIISDLNL